MNISTMVCSVCGVRATVARRKSQATGRTIAGIDPKTGKPIQWQEFAPAGPAQWYCRAHAPASETAKEFGPR